MFLKRLIWLLPLFISMPLLAQKNYNTIANRLIRLALTERQGYHLLGELCAIGPRLSGSPNSYRAYSWAKKKMMQIGLDRVWLEQVTVPHWVRGPVEVAFLAASGRKLAICALGGSVGTGPVGLTAKVLEVRSFDELRLRMQEARGKIVFLNRPFNPRNVNTFRSYGEGVRYRMRGAIEAAKVGALAVIVRSVTGKYDNVPHTGVMTYEEGIRKIPAAAVGLKDADYLSRKLIVEPNTLITLRLSCETRPDTLGYNVIGEIQGRQIPREVIVVGGHFGSWDKGQGAHDDGGGCMQALEVLSLYKRLKLRPKRTIRCVLFIDEEMTQTGAKVYADWVAATRQKHVAAIESDRGVFTPRGFSVDADSTILKRISEWLPLLRKAGIEWVRKGGSGVDIGKIKAVTAKIGYVPDNQRYFDFHHSDNDVFEAVHPREMQLGTAAMAILTWLISEEGLGD